MIKEMFTANLSAFAFPMFFGNNSPKIKTIIVVTIVVIIVPKLSLPPTISTTINVVIILHATLTTLLPIRIAIVALSYLSSIKEASFALLLPSSAQTLILYRLQFKYAASLLEKNALKNKSPIIIK